MEQVGSELCAVFRSLIRWLLAGKWATSSARSNSTSCCKLMDSAAETGVHDKASAVYICLPGTCVN